MLVAFVQPTRVVRSFICASKSLNDEMVNQSREEKKTIITHTHRKKKNRFIETGLFSLAPDDGLKEKKSLTAKTQFPCIWYFRRRFESACLIYREHFFGTSLPLRMNMQQHLFKSQPNARKYGPLSFWNLYIVCPSESNETILTAVHQLGFIWNATFSMESLNRLQSMFFFLLIHLAWA